MRIFVLGDIHLRDNVAEDYLDAQVQTLLDIWEKEDRPDRVVFLGDIFHYRKPTPKVLLKTGFLFKTISAHSNIDVVVGNHDQATKADDGVTALSLFESDKIRIWNNSGGDHDSGFYYIPYFENEKIIIKCLEAVPDGFTLFGHFAFDGCINAVGSYDFSIPTSCARNSGFLGHIHQHFIKTSGGRDLASPKNNLIFMGTPYPTMFTEAGKDHYYGLLTGVSMNWDTDIRKIDFGIRYMDIQFSDLESYMDTLFDPNYYTLLRVHMQAYENADSGNIRDLDKLPFVEYVYDPLIKEDEISDLNIEDQISIIDDSLIEKYVSEQSTNLEESDILKGLELLKKDEY